MSNSTQLVFILSSVLVIQLSACAPAEVTVTGTKEFKGENAQKIETQKATCKAGEVIETKSCSEEIKYSEVATRKVTCGSDGSKAIGQCRVSTCKTMFRIEGNKCVPECDRYGAWPDETCTSEIPNAHIATKYRYCTGSDTSSFVLNYGPCQVSQCESGYVLLDNKCTPGICKPNEDAAPLACPIPFGAGMKSKTCAADGQSYTYGSCILSSCDMGYHASENSCVANSCVPGSEQPAEDCTGSIPFSATATRAKTCNAVGDGYNYGTCTALSCLPGYVNQGNGCRPRTCDPNAILRDVSCTSEIANSLDATKTQTCNSNGSGYVYGECRATVCMPGFALESGGSRCAPPETFSITQPTTFKSYLAFGERFIGTISWTASSKATKNYAVMVGSTPSCDMTYWSTTTTGTSVGVPLIGLSQYSFVYVCVRAINTSNQSFPASNDGMAVLVR